MTDTIPTLTEIIPTPAQPPKSWRELIALAEKCRGMSSDSEQQRIIDDLIAYMRAGQKADQDFCNAILAHHRIAPELMALFGSADDHNRA